MVLTIYYFTIFIYFSLDNQSQGHYEYGVNFKKFNDALQGCELFPQYPRAHKLTLFKNPNFVNTNVHKFVPSGIIRGVHQSCLFIKPIQTEQTSA